MVGTKEFYELMDCFEKSVAHELIYGHDVERYGRDEKVPAGQFYLSGYVNSMFLAFLMGYQLHKSMSQS